MIIDSLAGRFNVTASGPEELVLSASSEQTLVSVLDGVELVGGAEGEDPTFSREDIWSTTAFHRRTYHARVTRPQLVRYFEYEVLNYLTYSSINEMHTLAHAQPDALTHSPSTSASASQGDKRP